MGYLVLWSVWALSLSLHLLTAPVLLGKKRANLGVISRAVPILGLGWTLYFLLQ